MLLCVCDIVKVMLLCVCDIVKVMLLCVCVCVCVFVCVSVKSHLTSGASVCLENTVTYSAGNGGQKICRAFSETASFRLWCYLLTYAILQQYCSSIMRHFSTAELSKAFKKANSRLSTTTQY